MNLTRVLLAGAGIVGLLALLRRMRPDMARSLVEEWKDAGKTYRIIAEAPASQGLAFVGPMTRYYATRNDTKGGPITMVGPYVQLDEARTAIKG